MLHNVLNDGNPVQSPIPAQPRMRLKKTGVGLFTATALVGEGAVNAYMFSKLLNLFSTDMPEIVSWLLILATVIPEFPLPYNANQEVLLAANDYDETLLRRFLHFVKQHPAQCALGTIAATAEFALVKNSVETLAENATPFSFMIAIAATLQYLLLDVAELAHVTAQGFSYNEPNYNNTLASHSWLYRNLIKIAIHIIPAMNFVAFLALTYPEVKELIQDGFLGGVTTKDEEERSDIAIIVAGFIDVISAAVYYSLFCHRGKIELIKLYTNKPDFHHEEKVEGSHKKWLLKTLAATGSILPAVAYATAIEIGFGEVLSNVSYLVILASIAKLTQHYLVTKNELFKLYNIGQGDYMPVIEEPLLRYNFGALIRDTVQLSLFCLSRLVLIPQLLHDGNYKVETTAAVATNFFSAIFSLLPWMSSEYLSRRELSHYFELNIVRATQEEVKSYNNQFAFIHSNLRLILQGVLQTLLIPAVLGGLVIEPMIKSDFSNLDQESAALDMAILASVLTGTLSLMARYSLDKLFKWLYRRQDNSAYSINKINQLMQKLNEISDHHGAVKFMPALVEPAKELFAINIAHSTPTFIPILMHYHGYQYWVFLLIDNKDVKFYTIIEDNYHAYQLVRNLLNKANEENRENKLEEFTFDEKFNNFKLKRDITFANHTGPRIVEKMECLLKGEEESYKSIDEVRKAHQQLLATNVNMLQGGKSFSERVCSFGKKTCENIYSFFSSSQNLPRQVGYNTFSVVEENRQNAGRGFCAAVHSFFSCRKVTVEEDSELLPSAMMEEHSLSA